MIELDISLRGLRVIEICNFVSGPMVGRNLASLGADVIKIERPVVGDDGRHAHPAFDGDGLFFTGTGYGKKSVVLDLKSDAGLDAAPTCSWKTCARRSWVGSAWARRTCWPPTRS